MSREVQEDEKLLQDHLQPQSSLACPASPPPAEGMIPHPSLTQVTHLGWAWPARGRGHGEASEGIQQRALLVCVCQFWGSSLQLQPCWGWHRAPGTGWPLPCPPVVPMCDTSGLQCWAGQSLPHSAGASSVSSSLPCGRQSSWPGFMPSVTPALPARLLSSQPFALLSLPQLRRVPP